MQPLTTAKEKGSDSILPEKRQGTLPVSVNQIKSIVLSGNIICRSLGFNHLTVTLIGGGPTGGVVGVVINGSVVMGMGVGVVMCWGIGVAWWVGLVMGMGVGLVMGRGVRMGMGVGVGMEGAASASVSLGGRMGEDVCMGIDVGLDGEAMMGTLVTSIISMAEVTFVCIFIVVVVEESELVLLEVVFAVWLAVADISSLPDTSTFVVISSSGLIWTLGSIVVSLTI